MVKNQFIALVITSLFSFSSKADSPLTSTYPAQAYKDSPLVLKELEDGKQELSAEECEFLYSDNRSLDLKFAFINALGVGDTTLVEVYTQFLMKKLDLQHAVFDSILTWRGNQPVAYAPASKLSYDQFACLGYLMAMGDYRRPLRAYYCVYHAVDLEPQSEAAAYMFGLIMAQFYVDTDGCKLYEAMVNVRDFGDYLYDRLHKEASDKIFEYINLYEEPCKQKATHEKNKNAYVKPEFRQKMEDKNNYVDLEVVSITAPEYVSEIDGSRIVVKIKNKGTISNIETNAKLKDLDITVEEAKKMKLDKSWIEAISENNGRSQYEEGESVTKGKDYDFNWELEVKVPIIQPGQEAELIFELKGYWIYDSNCEIEIELDVDQNIDEKREDNNKKVFIGWG